MGTSAYLLILCVSFAVGAEITPNVVGNNTKAIPEDAPWIVSLQMAKDDFAFCGATLIDSSSVIDSSSEGSGWVITAASCLQGISQASIIATLGNWNLLNDSIGIPLNIIQDTFIQHEKFNQSSHENDIALFKVQFDNETICEEHFLKVTQPSYVNETMYDKINASFAGWGLLVENGPLQKELFNTPIPLIPDGNCTKNYGHEVFKSLTMMCAGSEGFGPCSYDTGGPLACQSEQTDGTIDKWLCGIASFGNGCGKANSPAIFTDINYYADWIQQKISPETR